MGKRSEQTEEPIGAERIAGLDADEQRALLSGGR